MTQAAVPAPDDPGSPGPEAGVAARSGLVEQRLAFEAAVAALLAGSRQSIQAADRDLSQWTLDSHANAAALERILLAPGGSVQLVVHRSPYLESGAPRLAALRRRFSDRLLVRIAPASLPASEGLLIGDGRHLLRRASPEAYRGRLTLDDPGEVEAWRRKFSALWAECAETLPVTRLGL